MGVLNDLSALDQLACVIFFSGWLCYSWLADHTRLQQRSISAVMTEYRRRWLLVTLQRELRMVDTSIQGNLLQGVVFFASTTIIVIGGLLALLGSGDKALQVLGSLPFITPTSRELWEFKLLLLLGIFVYAFFKFSWAFRLFNYCSILIGSLPMAIHAEQESAQQLAERAARLNCRAAYHFNNGVRAYFFALAALAWFLHPGWFILATLWIIGVMVRREFFSTPLRILREQD